jgi:hypothetical protein
MVEVIVEGHAWASRSREEHEMFTIDHRGLRVFVKGGRRCRAVFPG